VTYKQLRRIESNIKPSNQVLTQQTVVPALTDFGGVSIRVLTSSKCEMHFDDVLSR